MKLIKYDPQFKITRWYVSPTINQDFSDGTTFPTASGIHCEPHVSHSTDKSDSLAILRLEWGFILKNYIEYIADFTTYLEFSDMSDYDEKINALIVFSYSRFLQEFDMKKTKFDFKKIPPFDKPKVDALHQKILNRLQKKSG